MSDTESEDTGKSIGRDTHCDLVISDHSVSPLHARLELDDNGSVWIQDELSRNGLFLNRNDGWIRAQKVSLCVGDRIRLGDHELPLEQLLAVFGSNSKLRLGERHFSKRQAAGQRQTQPGAPSRAMNKPRRNPLTGQIEEQQ